MEPSPDWVAWASSDDYFSDLAILSAGPLHPGGLPITQRVRSALNWDGKVALDVGCGTGFLGSVLQAEGARVIGLEPNPFMRFRAAARGIDARDIRAEDFDYSSVALDVVLFTGVVGFLPHPIDAVKAALSAIVTDGRLIIIDWVPDRPPPRLADYPVEVTGTLDPQTIALVLSREGWELEVSLGAVTTKRFEMPFRLAMRLARAAFPTIRDADLSAVVARKHARLSDGAIGPGPSSYYLAIARRRDAQRTPVPLPRPPHA